MSQAQTQILVKLHLQNLDKAFVQGGFFNWPPPEFAKCRPVSNQFEEKETLESKTGPPSVIGKS